MRFGSHVLSWRRRRGLTQLALAERARIPRPYLCRLELDKADPSLSVVRRLAVALNLRVGELVDAPPVQKTLTNEDLDHIARGALRPDSSALTNDKNSSYIRPLSRLLKPRRAALGLYKQRSGTVGSKTAGLHVLRRLRADLGEDQWQALLKRIDKHATFLAPKQHEDKRD